MGTSQEKHTLKRLIHDSIVQLCRSSVLYGGQFELDGIICISGQREGQELVVKLHERFGNNNAAMPSKYPINKHDTDREKYNRRLDPYHLGYRMASNILFPSSYHPINDIEPEMLDLRMNHSANNNRSIVDSRSETSPTKSGENIYSSPAKRWKPDANSTSSFFDPNKGDRESDLMDRSYSTNTSPSLDDQAENLSVSAANSEDGNSLSASSPDKSGQYLGKSPYISSPYHLQKKTPLKQERWTPSTPLPTVPECRQCGFTFESFEVLSEHNEAVHSVFTCAHCHKTFTSRSNLERHSRLHTGFKPYVCAICGKAFSRKDHLSNHSAKHAFKCGNCNKRYADKQSLATHFSYEHDSVLSNTCEYCNKGFSSLEACEEHIKTHPQYQAVQKSYQHKIAESPGPIPSKKYSCESCKFVAPDRITLLKHHLIHIDGQRCYTCLSCAKVFTDPLQYDEHIQGHDGQTNVFECCLCRNIFPTIDALQRHETVHLNEDLSDILSSGATSSASSSSGCPCPHCEKTLRSVPALQEHILQHAAGLLPPGKPYSGHALHKCLYCNMGFCSYAELCRHMDELRHYPPDPRFLFTGLGTPPSYNPATSTHSAFDARKYSDYLASSKRVMRELMLKGSGGYRSSSHNNRDPNEKGERVDSDSKKTEQVERNEESEGKQNTEAGTNGEVDEDRDNQETSDTVQEPQADATDADSVNDDNPEDIGSDIEVVEPEAPEDYIAMGQTEDDSYKKELQLETTDEPPLEKVKQEPVEDITDNDEEETPAIQNQPVKSRLCNKNSNNSAEPPEGSIVNEDEAKMASLPRDIPIPVPVATESSLTNGIDDPTQSENCTYAKGNPDRARKRKGPSPEKYINDEEPVDMSMNDYYGENYDMESLASENSNHTMHSSSFESLTQHSNAYSSHLQGLLNSSVVLHSENKLQMQLKSERKREVSRITPNKTSVDIPQGPTTCSICQTTMANFHVLEQHCFAEHNRCPCMFCPKTFAQKANRDRHVCLHTGDKPYECPECGEKFSRGDKLKLHRVRTHNIPTQSSGYGSGGASSGPNNATPKRDSLTPGREWRVASPAITEPDSWAILRDETNAVLAPSGGEWMVQENMSY